MRRDEVKSYFREVAALPDRRQRQGAMVLFLASLTPAEQAEIPGIARELVEEAVAQLAAELRLDRQ